MDKILRNPTVTSLLFVLIVLSLSCERIEKPKPFLTGQGIGLSQTTLLVEDIEQAKQYFVDTLGFNIYRGITDGAFDGTLSSSIILGDMTVFELLSANDALSQDSIVDFLSSDAEIKNGVRLFSLSTSSIDSTYMTLNKVGLKTDSVQSYRTSGEEVKGWSWDNGNDQRKSLDFNSANPPRLLPRFIESIDYGYADVQKDWNTYYIFRRMYNTHPNGVVGISGIKIAVQNPKEVSAKYESMGLTPDSKSDSSISFPVFRHQKIYLESALFNSDLGELVMDNGEGVYAVQFDVENLDSTYHYFQSKLPEEAMDKMTDRLIISSEFAYGMQLEFVQEPQEQAILARKLSPLADLDTLAIEHASQLYVKYCALCHGENREGYTADNAPSLRSKSLLGTSKGTNFMRYTIQFGRANTAMGGYYDSHGGPLEYIEIELLLEYLNQMAGVKERIELSREPVMGNIENGSILYSQHCAACHGNKGEGISAPALANPMLLATATDHFLRYAIAEGRDGTPMMAFKDSLKSNEIDDLTTFLRSRASGWDIPMPESVTVPTAEQLILNPENEAPDFELREGKFVAAEQVNRALEEGKRMIILDARSEVAWRQMHIPGAAPVPYYAEPDEFIHDIPNDGTQIVIYCACPHAASERVLNTLRRYGYENTAIIDEGILVWAQMGFPVQSGS
ncbi:c-type cytochrome [Algoriphagus sediminis]|uniref:C-type cytochrome n=1 Tax=Algoriphagus sediminis TaxID=3057113 RepID=A0ABT7YD47_9BACT|nr:c-type cytochrome [Algoriphagus sediminis]MDN3204417.1 c-type cytochrome [Algoriphagus sediminis]